ncbi:Nucleic-acid-binding protein from transposon X-element [Araneus ventricosus]|uniref:Nucleic-acid-binding protein from transposon X-element n=1 Tax=Araneus ventricosus TaxID=182803 RepID=A0A4Y2B365_ARAVE|nr:Nucleic-acid-binding protein from transposon X-element [Araneus ventricosus]
MSTSMHSSSSIDQVSASHSLHASATSECTLVPSNIDELNSYIASNSNPQTLELCCSVISVLEAYLDSLDKSTCSQEHFLAVFHLYKLSSIRSGFLTEKLAQLIHENETLHKNADCPSDSSSSSSKTQDKPKKRLKHKSSFSQRRNNKKFQKIDPSIITSNRFKPIAESEDENEMEHSNVDEEFPLLSDKDSTELGSQAYAPNHSNTKDKSVTPNKRHYIPPIIIDNPSNATQLIKSFNELTMKPVEGRMISKDRFKVFPPDADAHRAIQKSIKDNNLKSHTFELEEERQLKVVIRNLPADFPPQDIIDTLKGFQFKPTQCHPLRHRKTNTNMPLFLVTLPKTADSKEIFQLTSIGHFRVKVEPLKRKTTPAQFYNCQDFYHHSRFCLRDPKCLKCAGKHTTQSCKKPADTPATCCHCNGPHTANFSGCPENPINKKQEKEAKQPKRSFKPAPSNAWSNPQALAQVKAPALQQASFIAHDTNTPQNSSKTPLQTVSQTNSGSPLLLQISQMINSFMAQLNTVLQNSQVGQHVQQL